ncbi:MAG: hypothetical protein JSS63_14425 [Bacteroidetes bacterium]|nr:hypothetical protein [Bacteroidota bacterium]MBX7046566.1 hypothetical protein [Ignavibacteria bacterium]
MKKLLLIVLLVISASVVSQAVNAQSLYFCEDVSKDGYPIGESTVFTIPSGGGYLKMLVRLPYTLDVYSVRYEVYKVDSYGNETYDNTIYQDTEKSWVWFWKQITFYKSGNYNVYVYDSNNYLLASSSIKIKY